jgi:L-aspartate oxidase
MPADKIEERFPTICASCREYGVDPTKEPVPVVPAAHYFCGGVWVDERGRTNLDRLYAIGEVSCTGVHGANRLGSASLLEGLVWGKRAAEDIVAHIAGWQRINPTDIPNWEAEEVTEPADPALVELDMATLKHTMWYYVGLVRSRLRLERAQRDLNTLRHDIDAFYRKTSLSPEVISLRNAVLAGIIVEQAAWGNHESHGCHYRAD